MCCECVKKKLVHAIHCVHTSPEVHIRFGMIWTGRRENNKQWLRLERAMNICDYSRIDIHIQTILCSVNLADALNDANTKPNTILSNRPSVYTFVCRYLKIDSISHYYSVYFIHDDSLLVCCRLLIFLFSV